MVTLEESVTSVYVAVEVTVRVALQAVNARATVTAMSMPDKIRRNGRNFFIILRVRSVIAFTAAVVPAVSTAVLEAVGVIKAGYRKSHQKRQNEPADGADVRRLLPAKCIE